MPSFYREDHLLGCGTDRDWVDAPRRGQRKELPARLRDVPGPPPGSPGAQCEPALRGEWDRDRAGLPRAHRPHRESPDPGQEWLLRSHLLVSGHLRSVRANAARLRLRAGEGCRLRQQAVLAQEAALGCRTHGRTGRAPLQLRGCRAAASAAPTRAAAYANGSRARIGLREFRRWTSARFHLAVTERRREGQEGQARLFRRRRTSRPAHHSRSRALPRSRLPHPRKHIRRPAAPADREDRRKAGRRHQSDGGARRARSSCRPLPWAAPSSSY